MRFLNVPINKLKSCGWSWFKFNNLRLVLGQALIFYSSMTKGLKLKFKVEGRGLVRDLFALSSLPIQKRVKNELIDSCPVKTIKKEKYRFHCFIVCSVKVTCIVTIIILKNMFGDKNQLFEKSGLTGPNEILVNP